MKVLLVEDDDSVVTLLQDALSDAGIEFSVAGTGDEAMDALRRGAFDLVVCDLRLPMTGGEAPRDEVGIGVLEEIGETCPGTTTIVLSAYADLDNIGRFQRAGVDDWMLGPTGFRISDAFRKDDFAPPIARIREYADQSHELRRVELGRGVVGMTLSHHQEQVLRAFVIRQHGTRGVLEPVVGGLSSTSKVRVTVLNDDGAVLSKSVGRIDLVAHVHDEATRYEGSITALPPGSFAHLIAKISAGAGSQGGLFYRLADGYDYSMIDVLLRDPALAAKSVGLLEDFENVWSLGAPTSRVSVADVRRCSISDADFAAVAPRLGTLDWAAFEAQDVVVPRVRQHGDMHVFNVLVREDGQPLLIDYANAGPTLGPLDPITLELSLLFHRDARAPMSGWPTVDHAREWADVNAFADNSPHKPYLVACREWAHRLSSGDRAVAACAYGYTVRQLKYDNVDVELATGVIESILNQGRSW